MGLGNDAVSGEALVPTFSGFDALAAHFAAVISRLPTVRAKALDHVGTVVAEAAKAKLGEYQAAAGPFAAWADLADSTLEQKGAKGYPSPSPLLNTGEHIRDTIETRVVDGKEVHIGSDDPVADYQERGTDRIPPRSFLGAALFEQSPALVKHVAAEIERAING